MDGLLPKPWVASPSDAFMMNDDVVGDVTFDVTTDVAAFLAGTADNHGWIVKKRDELAAGRVELGARESGSGPRLLLTFNPSGSGGGSGGHGGDGTATSTVGAGGSETSPASSTTTTGTAPGTGGSSPTSTDAGSSPSAATTTGAGGTTSFAECDPGELDDGNPCTIDSCDAALGVIHTPDEGAPCADTDVDQCNGAGMCNADGTCVPGLPPVVDDGDDCTIDTCDPTLGVQHTACTDPPGGVASTFGNAFSFLVAGPEAPQRDVTAELGDAVASGVTGHVSLPDGAPAVGAIVRIAGRPELGWTVTDASGEFVMLAEGGRVLTVDVQLVGHLPVHREIATQAQAWSRAPDVRLTALEGLATTIDLVEITAITDAPGATEMDAGGVRQGTLLVRPGTQATMTFADGGAAPLEQLSVRITEYTVGADGPEKMPAELPPRSEYTYAVELSVDEALQAGATGVAFDRPVFYYVQATGFLEFPVGAAVPSGRYDRELRRWVPQDNGRVIEVLGETAGVAEVDVDGDGAHDPSSDPETMALGLSEEELAKLASLYQPGDVLWRVPLVHFSPCDLNWPHTPPDEADCPTGDCDDVAPPRRGDEGTTDDPCVQVGSIIECENQVLGESIRLPGTPMSLHYRSNRVPGHRTSNEVTAPLTARNVAGSLRAATVKVEVAGVALQTTVSCDQGDCAPEVEASLVWDGRDRFGRTLTGRQLAKVTQRLEYPVVYGLADDSYEQAFARASTLPSTVESPYGVLAREKVSHVWLGGRDARSFGLGGWTLDAVHVYDPASRVVTYGDGTRRTADVGRNEYIIERVTLPATFEYPEPGPARTALACDGGNVLRVPVDGPPVVLAAIPDGQTNCRAVIPASDGALYVFTNGRRLYRRELGQWVHVAGNGSSSGSMVSGTLATQGPIADFTSIFNRWTASADGSLLFVDQVGLREIGTDGIVTTVFATANGADVLAFPDGSARFLTRGNAVYHVDRWRKVSRIAGGGVVRAGGAALSTQIGNLNTRALGADSEGALFFTNGWQAGGVDWSLGQTDVVRRLHGKEISTVVGGFNASPLWAANLPALGTKVSLGRSQAGGQLTFHDWGSRSILVGQHSGVEDRETPLYVMRPQLPDLGFAAYYIPSADGSVLDEFDTSGRHVSSRDARTGLPITSIEYDAAGRIVSVTSWAGVPSGASGRTTSIHREQQEVQITGPDGHVTTLTLDADGWLEAVQEPGASANDTYALGYSSDGGGLLTSFRKPASVTPTVFRYDALGRLVEHENPGGRVMTLERDDLETGSSVTITSPSGLPKVYANEILIGGEGRRSATPAGSTSTIRMSRPDGRTVTTRPDGTVVTREMAMDPRWGMLSAYVAKETVAAPGLPARTVVRRRCVNDTSCPSIADPFAATALIEEEWINPTFVGSTPTGPRSEWRLDLTTLEESFTSAAGRRTVRVLDAAGRIERVRWLDAAGVDVKEPRRFAHDEAARLVEVLQGEGSAERSTTLAYRSDGLLGSITNALAETTSFDWTGGARPASVTRADGGMELFAFDESGNLDAVTPPGRPSHVFAQDDDDLLTRYEPPAPSIGTWATSYAHDADGRVESTSRPDGVVLDHVRSPTTGLLEDLVVSDAWRIHREHDGAGRVVALEGPRWQEGEPLQSISLSYGGQAILSESYTGSVSGSVSWTYDARHLRATETVLGQPITLLYDEDGLLTSAGELAITRDPATGRVDSIASTHEEHSFLEVRTYDPGFGELATIEYTRDGGSLLRMTLDRDGLGRIARRTEALYDGTPVLFEYEYDPAGRLTAVTRDGELVEVYEYDTNGNRTLAEYGPVVRSATYDVQDRLEAYGDWSLVHGPNGELESRLTPSGHGLITEYDPFGGLTTARVEVGGVLREYLNDARGRRLETREDGALVGRWLWRSALQPVAELDEGGAGLARYLYADGGNVPELVVTAAGNRWRLVKDHLGSVRLVVDVATGEVLRAMDFDAFGRVRSLSGAADVVPFGFAGGMWDSLTGLVRFGARDYDPETGRWTAKDPIRFDGGDTNIYAYVGNDPINRLDLTGRSATCSEAAECSAECRVNFAECWTLGVDIEECRSEERACDANCTVGFCDNRTPSEPKPEGPSPFEFVPPADPGGHRDMDRRPWNPVPERDERKRDPRRPKDLHACE